jgi:hypothetical protein
MDIFCFILPPKIKAPLQMNAGVPKNRNKSYALIFFHPDFTVGTGISPVQPSGSWTLPPVWNYTIP